MKIVVNDKEAIDGIAALFQRVFIDEEGANTDGDAGKRAFYEWKYAPGSLGENVSVTAQEESGVVVGHTGMIAQRALGPKGNGMVALNVDSAVDRGHRSLTTYLSLMKRAIAEARSAGAGLVYSHANANAEPMMRKALRFERLFSFRALVYAPVRLDAPFSIYSLAARGLGLLSFLRGAGALKYRSGPVPERLERFPEGFAQPDSSLRHSAADADRRFLRCPTRRYEAWKVPSGPGPGGDAEYLILGKRKVPRGLPIVLALSVYRDCSKAIDGEEPRARGRALARAAGALRMPVVYFANDEAASSALRNTGFVDVTRYMKRFLGGAVDVIGLPLDGVDWSGFRCSLGDIDT